MKLLRINRCQGCGGNTGDTYVYGTWQGIAAGVAIYHLACRNKWIEQSQSEQRPQSLYTAGPLIPIDTEEELAYYVMTVGWHNYYKPKKI